MLLYLNNLGCDFVRKEHCHDGKVVAPDVPLEIWFHF